MLTFQTKQLDESYVPSLENLVREASSPYCIFKQGYFLKVLQFKGIIVGAFLGNKLVGFCTLELPLHSTRIPPALVQVEGIQLGHYGFIGDTLVSQCFRGKGLQKKMTLDLLSHIESLELYHVFTLVEPDNLYSMNNILSCGFSEFKQLELSGKIQAIMMKVI